MLVSGCIASRLRGNLLSSLLGAPHGLHCICLLAGLCERSFCSLIFKPFSLSTLPLVSIWSGKYSTDWVQCDGALSGGCLQGYHGYLLPRATLLPGSTNLFRHQLPSSSIVDEFNFNYKANWLLPSPFSRTLHKSNLHVTLQTSQLT